MKQRVRGRVSFVIPTRNNARTIGACVASAATQPGDVEVVVVDNHSTDGTATDAHEAGADLVFVAGPERSAQRNRGFESSSGEIVVFVDSDMVLEPGLSAALRGCFENEEMCAVVLPETAFGEGYLASSRALEKRMAVGDPAVEAARAFRSSVLERVGGYDERLFGFEDYELADRVAACGLVGRAPIGVRHDEGRISAIGLLRKKYYYGTQWRHGKHGLAANRKRARRIRPSLLFADARHVPGLVLLKVVDVAGLTAGAVHAEVRRRRGRTTQVTNPA